MVQHQKMILDSNVFIEAKNRYYAFDICPSYWDFVIRDFASGNAASILHVWDELETGGDDLTVWMKSMLDREQFYDCSRNDGVLAQHRLISSYVADAYSSKQNAIHVFLQPGAADPWLAAYAMVHGGTIVTQETAKLSKRKVSLVDICNYFGVRHMDMIKFLRIEQARFVLDGNARLKGQRITSCCASHEERARL